MQRAVEGTEHTLRDGIRVLIRPLRAEDIGRPNNGIKGLSESYRIGSVLTARVERGDESPGMVTNADREEHREWVAIDPSDAGERLLGVARYFRSPSEPQQAEIWIGVVDSCQRRGLGTVLVRTLAVAAAEHGIRSFVAHFSASDAAGLRLLRSLGSAAIVVEGGLAHVEVALSGIAAADRHAGNRAGERGNCGILA